MVTVKQHYIYTPEGDLDLESWLDKIKTHYELTDVDLIRQSAKLADETCKGLTTFYGKPSIEQGLEIAEMLLDMHLDQDAIAAAILANAMKNTGLTPEIIKEKLGEKVSKLIQGILQMNTLNQLTQKSRSQSQMDLLRKTFLAMVSDIRVVLIKLAEHTCIIRGIKHINPNEQKRIAQETLDIYAPLANRLGIGQLKWEMEDIAFHYSQPEIYKMISKFLAERRVDREKRIHDTIAQLKESFAHADLSAKFSGRAKHIYSIYLKAKRKQLDYKEIFDYSAVRILVPTLTDCYTALSIAHELFEHIPDEFDDYISHPKPNGYRSIHTAVIGPDGKNLEIQIRTIEMHDEAEHGIAAHWLYKEDKTKPEGYEAKITFLHQLLAWQKDVAEDTAVDKIFSDRVYVFTPRDEIIDLAAGATPLDFAYHLHSELGHRCRGAKMNGHIVPLTYHLRTGDKVEIITTPHGGPSRDWLNKNAGYLHTSSARNKVSRWFKQQDVTQYVETGKQQLEKELLRANIPHPNFEKIAAQFHFKNPEAFFAAIGHGQMRPAQVIHALRIVPITDERHKTSRPIPSKSVTDPIRSVQIAGISDLLTRIARCCKPISGDPIIGYITQGRGVSIHRTDCSNILIAQSRHNDRLIQVKWDTHQSGYY